MKVRYLFSDKHLEYEGEYNVFAIQEWNTKEKKIYISDYSSTGFDITPYDYDAFEIVDTRISKFWEYGLDQFGQTTIGIPEMFNLKNFLERYYNGDSTINDILDLYYKIGKEDLFNVK